MSDISQKPLYKFTSIVLLVIGASFVSVAGTMITYSNDVVSVHERYDDEPGCDSTTWKTPGQCNVTLELDRDMDEPVFLYYELTNFNQNNRYYRRSINWEQLRGEDQTDKEIFTCKPYDRIADLGYTPDGFDKDDTMNPCGIGAKTFFNDTFELLDPDGRSVKVEFDDLVIEEVKNRFERHDDWQDKQWTDVEDSNRLCRTLRRLDGAFRDVDCEEALGQSGV
jgi:hypothetical protein